MIFFTNLKKIEINMYVVSTILFLLLIVTALVVYYDTKKEEKNFFDIVEKHAEALKKSIDNDIVSFLNGDKNSRYIIENKLLKNREVNYYKIVNEYDIVCLSNIKPEINLNLNEVILIDKVKNEQTISRMFINNHGIKIFEMIIPVFSLNNKKILGKIVLGISMDEIHLVVNATRYKLIALGFSLFMLGGAGILFNISYYSYRNLQNALENIKSYTNSILLSMDLGVIATDLNGKISIVNNSIKKILGIENLYDKNIFEIFSDKIEIKEIFREALNNFKGIETKEIQYQEGGKNKFLRITTSILKNNNNIAIGLVLLVEDVTQIKELEKRVYREDKVSALGRLASGIAHEIKNPLSAMNINVQLVEEGLVNNTNIDIGTREKLLHYINVINLETCRLEEIIKNFIDFTKLDVIKKEKILPVALKTIIEQVVNLIDPEARRRNVIIDRNITFTSNVYLNCDQNKIKQLLLNLIINSLQAMPLGGKLTINVYCEQSFLGIEIVDTGVGIRKEDQDKIFDLFYTTKKAGSGLGLFICQRIVEEHNGIVEFVTTPGKGTRFTIKLPLEKENA